MNYPLGKTNENVNYPIHSNSSAASWMPTTSDQGSLAALIKNDVVVIRQNTQFAPELSSQPVQEHLPANW
jgi:hypothetical protein